MDMNDRLELLETKKMTLENKVALSDTEEVIRKLIETNKMLVKSTADNLDRIGYLDGQVTALMMALTYSLQTLDKVTGAGVRSFVLPKLREAETTLFLVSIFQDTEIGEARNDSAEESSKKNDALEGFRAVVQNLDSHWPEN